MTKEQAQQVLDEMQGVRPEMLNGEAKRLFEAIMKIADERDEAYKIIDLMAETISFIDIDIKTIQRQIKEQYCDYIKSDVDCCWKTDKNCTDCIKEYFENKAKELLNK